MARCHTCGNDYAKSFEVITAAGERYAFDSIECAARTLAPTCAHCGCTILGHGVEEGAATYCCAHCARHAQHGSISVGGAGAAGTGDFAGSSQ